MGVARAADCAGLIRNAGVVRWKCKKSKNALTFFSQNGISIWLGEYVFFAVGSILKGFLR